jgi:hypothetical protein
MTGGPSMEGYYARGLAGERLRRCYELAPDRVRRYLEAEIRFVLSRLAPAGSPSTPPESWG